MWGAGSGGVRLVDLLPIDFGRLAFSDAGALRILTADSPRDGIVPPADKFAIHTPHAASGLPMRGGLPRVTAMAYLGKHFAIKDWLIFAEVFGMPVRIARYQPNATAVEKRELLDMLKQLGADATGIFSKAVEIDIKQTRLPGETNLFENLCLYFDREISKAWLGQTLTTDTIRCLRRAGGPACMIASAVTFATTICERKPTPSVATYCRRSPGSNSVPMRRCRISGAFPTGRSRRANWPRCSRRPKAFGLRVPRDGPMRRSAFPKQQTASLRWANQQ
ncbi:MAG: DUF935 family protein [Planctomycetes bacterium]|nr:DUF935 family protein [Planctomycetota bacterium]